MDMLNLNKLIDEIYDHQQYLSEFGGYDELEVLGEVEGFNEYDSTAYGAFFSEGDDDATFMVDL